jgi:hypothetical protein
MSKSQNKLNLTKLEQTHIKRYENEVNIFEEVELIIQKSEREQIARWKYPIGETISTIKKRICDENNLSFNDVKLYINDTPNNNKRNYLLDPLSLNDIPIIVENKKQPVVINVEITSTSTSSPTSSSSTTNTNN